MKKQYSKAEKKSWWNGVRYGRKNPKKKVRKKKSYTVPGPGAYNSRGRVNGNLVDDRHGSVVFWDDFDYDSKGRIKGSYTPDGFFEPD